MNDIDNYFKEQNSTKNEEKNEEKEIVLGIDLGTTNCCMGIWRNNNFEVIPIDGDRTMPSVVAFTNKSIYIGKEAKRQIELNTDNTYYEIKRLIGRKITDQSVINDIPFLTYRITGDEQGNILILNNLQHRKDHYTAEEISSLILMRLKNVAESYLKKKVTKAIITVPAYFNDSQRHATKDAARIAGLDCLRIINEPTAAALAYGLNISAKHKNDDINVLVYDLGGGTLDISLLNIYDDVFHVLGASGITHMGGADFDNRLIEYCLDQFKKRYLIPNLDKIRSISMQKLKKACENAKKLLSTTHRTFIGVKDFHDGKNLLVQITRNKLESICRDLFILCLEPVEDVLSSCEMKKEDIDEIILVGGATRMPIIKNNLRTFFNGKKPNASVNPDEVVGAGAAIKGYILANNDDPFSENIILLDIIPLSFGVETIGGVMNILIPRNSAIPIKRKKKYTTDSDYETSVTVKIYEGERQMTKDNFLVGEFELQGIEAAPRGVAQIEITFAIDVNGIVNVTAKDLNNEQNENTITIKSNKGRLSEKRIKELILEAEDMEREDIINREKRQLFYEIEDLCANIKLNIDNKDEFKLKDKDREYIHNDITKILNWLKEKKYNDRNRTEYIDILKRIKKKYSTLMLRISHKQDKVKGLNDNSMGTKIFGNEEDEETIFKVIEEEDLGISDFTDKDNVKQLREETMNLCHNILEIISSENIKISSEDLNDIKDYIDDILLWIHVAEKITAIEYKQKLDEINEICDKIVNKYDTILDNNEIEKKISTKKDELEQLCYTLKSSVECNLFNCEKKYIEKLINLLDYNLNWLIDIECENKSIDDEIYQKHIDDINTYCNYLYENVVSFDQSEVIMNEENLMNSLGTPINKIEE